MSINLPTLGIEDHDRDVLSLQYVYPVVSRRAGGVSIGINLNPNNACNWACIYCQVPGLQRGGAPEIDLGLLVDELVQVLDMVVFGDFLPDRVAPDMRRLADVSFSGNGEPTSSRQFLSAVQRVTEVLRLKNLEGRIPLRVITNGSLVGRPDVLRAFSLLAGFGGEVWFKIDRARASDILVVNRAHLPVCRLKRNLALAARVVPIVIQTCWFGLHGRPPSREETDAYVNFVVENKKLVKGVHIYGIARPSMQPGFDSLSRLESPVLEELGRRLASEGVQVDVYE